jgi:hypothetical protein
MSANPCIEGTTEDLSDVEKTDPQSKRRAPVSPEEDPMEGAGACESCDHKLMICLAELPCQRCVRRLAVDPDVSGGCRINALGEFEVAVPCDYCRSQHKSKSECKSVCGRAPIHRGVLSNVWLCRCLRVAPPWLARPFIPRTRG